MVFNERIKKIERIKKLKRDLKAMKKCCLYPSLVVILSKKPLLKGQKLKLKSSLKAINGYFISTLKYLIRRGHTFRNDINFKCDFMEFLKVYNKDQSSQRWWLQREQNYTHFVLQNEMILGNETIDNFTEKIKITNPLIY